MHNTRRQFLKSTLAAGAIGGPNACIKKQTPPPNIVLFITDDHRYDVLGCAGHSVVKTPNIDKLAAGGYLFENAFVTTPICAASRASILLGLPERSHNYTFRTARLNENFNDRSFPSILRSRGYITGHIGKFGVAVENGFIESNFDYYQPVSRIPYLHTLEDGTLLHETDAISHYAIEFLSENSKTEKPFQLTLSFNAPHAADKKPVEKPFPAPSSSRNAYAKTAVDPPKISPFQLQENLPPFLRDSLNRDRYFWRWNGEKEYEENIRDYFSMITGIDNAIGAVMKKIRTLGIEKNTVVIFMSDNGFYLGDRGFAGKWTHYEQSIRIPLIVNDPRLQHSGEIQIRDQMALNVDIAPTILDIADIPEENQHYGRSLKPLMSESPSNWRNDFLCEHLMHHERIPRWEGVRSNRFTYVRYIDQDPVYEFLHDHQNDPDQVRNMVSLESYHAITEGLRQKCTEHISIASAWR